MMKPMLFRFGTVFAAILTLVVCAQAADKSLIKLNVGYTPISGAALPLFIAVEEKLFQRHGLEVFPVFMGGSPLINSAILAGEFQLGYTAGGAVISSRLAGSDLITIACPLPALVIDAWARPEIKSVADLRGKRIGVTRFGASTHFAGLSMLDSAGIKPNEVVFIQNGGVGESLAALIGGRVDASMIGYPFGLRAKAAGFPLLFRPMDSEYGLFPTSVIAARESWLKDARNHRIALDFLRAMNEGLQLTRESENAVKRVLRKYTRVEDEALLQGSAEYFREAFPKTLATPEKAMANALKFIEHPKAKGYDVRQSFDNALVNEIK
jgi:NitT/TauT family transport system substrate-binding protein